MAMPKPITATADRAVAGFSRASGSGQCKDDDQHARDRGGQTNDAGNCQQSVIPWPPSPPGRPPCRLRVRGCPKLSPSSTALGATPRMSQPRLQSAMRPASASPRCPEVQRHTRPPTACRRLKHWQAVLSFRHGKCCIRYLGDDAPTQGQRLQFRSG